MNKEVNWEALLDNAIYNNYIDKLSELKRVTGKCYSAINNQWNTPGRPDGSGYAFMELNHLIVESGKIEYNRFDVRGYVVESFKMDLSELRTKQLKELLDGSTK